MIFISNQSTYYYLIIHELKAPSHYCSTSAVTFLVLNYNY